MCREGLEGSIIFFRLSPGRLIYCDKVESRLKVGVSCTELLLLVLLSLEKLDFQDRFFVDLEIQATLTFLKILTSSC